MSLTDKQRRRLAMTRKQLRISLAYYRRDAKRISEEWRDTQATIRRLNLSVETIDELQGSGPGDHTKVKAS